MNIGSGVRGARGKVEVVETLIEMFLPKLLCASVTGLLTLARLRDLHAAVATETTIRGDVRMPVRLRHAKYSAPQHRVAAST